MNPFPFGQPPLTPPTEAYVSFSAEVDVNTVESLIAVFSNILQQQIPKVTLLLSTQGGSVMHGVNAYNILRGLPIELVTHNVGNVDSIGNAIFLAGSKRYACPHSTFMFHGVGLTPPNGYALAQPELENFLANILADQNRIGSIIDERTSLNSQQIAELFKGQNTKDAAYAVSVGIVDEVRDVQITPHMPMYALTFQRQH